MATEYTYSLPFEAFESVGGQVLTPGPVSVSFDTVRLMEDAWFALFDCCELETIVSGLLMVTATVGVEQVAGNGRTVVEVYLEHMPAGGSFEIVGGSYGLVYLRNSSDGNFGSAKTSAAIQVGDGDRIRVRAARRSGTGELAVAPNAAILSGTFVAR